MNPDPPIFAGPDSLRIARESIGLVWAAVILMTVSILSALTQLLQTFSVREIALLIIVGMIYVTLARGRLIGSSIRVHAGQFGHIDEIARECAQMLRIPQPNVFVRDDPAVPIVAVGIGEPYSLIISAQWVDHLSPDEMRFLVARELAHIAAGHTRFTSLLSINGRENPIVSVIFGSWLRRTEYTADRLGLFACGSLAAAYSAISVSSFHSVGRKIDLVAFAEQEREIEADRSLRAGEYLASTPYATHRIDALARFAQHPLYAQWTQIFARARLRETPVEFSATTTRNGRKIFAGPWRRALAFCLDLVLVNTLLPAEKHLINTNVSTEVAKHVPHVVSYATSNGELFIAQLVFAVYVVGFVAITGQTFGMMIVDVRVVDDQLERIGFGRAVWRYVCLWFSLVMVFGFFRAFYRVQTFEKWSKTRLVGTAAFTARQARPSPAGLRRTS